MSAGTLQADVQPSATNELSWALYRVRSAVLANESPHLGTGAEISPALARRVVEFWPDGGTTFGELAVLSHWSGSSFELDISAFLQRLPETLATATYRQLGLASDRPDERAVLELRIRRLAAEPSLHRDYEDLLRSVWTAIEDVWTHQGVHSVLAACASWRHLLATRVPLLELLPADHTVFGLGLEPLVEAALARHEVVVSPGYFLTRGHVLDLAGVVSVGVSSEERKLVKPFSREGSRIAQFSRLFADPKRSAIVLMLTTTTATVKEMSRLLGGAESTIRRHIRCLWLAGIVEHVNAGPPARYRTALGGVDGVLNEVSSLLHRGHGRSSQLHAHEVSANASFRAIFDRAPIAMLQLDLDGRCISCNDAAQRLFGYSATDLSQLRGVHLLADDADGSALEVSADTAKADQYRDVRLRRKDGSTFWSALTLSVVYDDDGRPRFGYAMIEDISQRRGAEDLVTGLPNRALFMTRLDRILSLSRRAGDEVTVLMIDLDGFKVVNDTFGHQAGDEVLREVGSRLMAALRSTDVVARFGGDEFAVIPAGVTTAAAALSAAAKLRNAIRRPMVLTSGRTATVGASVGIALSPTNGRTAHELLRSADLAMYTAKHAPLGVMAAPSQPSRPDGGQAGPRSSRAVSAPAASISTTAARTNTAGHVGHGP